MSLSLANRTTYGFGGSVYAVKEAAYAMFVLLFYTQVLGLSGTATGIVLAISVVWDAITDPMMGSLSDRLSSRWGRRHPFMIFSVLPLAIGFIALFAPPAMIVADSFYLACWLLGCSLWIRTALTVFAIPHLALVAEITQDYHERSRLFGYRTAMLFFVTLLLPAFSLYFLFVEDGGVDGRFVPANYEIYGWMSAGIVIFAAAVTIGGTWKFIEKTKIDAAKMPSTKGLFGMVDDFLSTFRSVNFRNVLYYDLMASSSYGITIALNLIIWTYFWELDASDTGLLMGISVILTVPLAVLTIAPIGRAWPKHKIVRFAVIAMLIDLLWLYPLRVFDLIPANGHPLVFVLLTVQNALFMYFFILRIVSVSSITADLTDEYEVDTGKRQEGGFYSVLQFTTKLGTAVGPLYGGFALDVIGLNEGMLPGAVGQDILYGLVWAVVAGVVPLMLIAWAYTFRFSMTEDQLHEIHQKIKMRNSADD